jgi:hypothetical protein
MPPPPTTTTTTTTATTTGSAGPYLFRTLGINPPLAPGRMNSPPRCLLYKLQTVNVLLIKQTTEAVTQYRNNRARIYTPQNPPPQQTMLPLQPGNTGWYKSSPNPFSYNTPYPPTAQQQTRTTRSTTLTNTWGWEGFSEAHRVSRAVNDEMRQGRPTVAILKSMFGNQAYLDGMIDGGEGSESYLV